jgi:phage tail sheath protein FI|tara:strand:- start:309 stop:2285 length:1977 start_codon:yes stop_codon:yes gene_type:complete
MAFLVSPGVLVTEKDLTNVVPAVSTSIGGAVVVSERGPMEEVTLISSEDEFVSVFGKPDSSTFEYFFSATNFLQYGNALKVVRAATGCVNAAVSGTPVLIKNTTDYLNNYSTGQGSVGAWAAREAGTWGNNLQVSTCTNSTAYSQTASGLVNDATAAIGDTTITVDAGTQFQVGDLLEFGDISNNFTAAPSGNYYKITNIATHVLTIARFDPATGATQTGGLRHAVADNAFVKRYWEHYFQFSAAPSTTDDVSNAGGSNDELHIAIVDQDGGITGTAGSILEKFEGLSQASDAKTAQGDTNYYADVIYQQSQYIYWMDHQTVLSTAGNTKTGTAFDNASTSAHIVFQDALTGGTDDLVPTAAELSLAWDKFGDAETVDVNLLIGGPSQTNADATGDTMATKVIDTAEFRKDCVAFISPARADVVNVTNPIAQTANVKAFADGLASSSYAVVDSGYKYMYDKYNAVYRFVPLNGDIAGLCARTDNVADAWFSPAGFSRGQVRGAIKLAFDPTNAQRDELYKARVNPVVTFPGQGTVLFGDKTMQTKPSAFDRINVRRLFIVLEKAIATAAKFQLFEFNDEFTRANFRNLIEPFLRDVQGRRGITDFSVVCDETNNTSALIDRNEFIADIFIKPNRSINFIQLNFVATRTGVAFSEVAGA